MAVLKTESPAESNVREHTKAATEAAGAAQMTVPQTKAPLALLYGEPLESWPQGLYIPPDALRVFLERFEGPLDLLLYLIRSQKFDVMDIPMAIVTDQYMAYVELIRRSNLGLAAAYLVMAATLMSIKSRLLLPAAPAEDGEAEPEDPRAELMRRLLEYEKIKAAARRLNALPRLGRDFSLLEGVSGPAANASLPPADPEELASAWLDVVARMKLSARHLVTKQSLSVREHMTAVLKQLSERAWITLDMLIKTDGAEAENEREAITVWCLALLELAKINLVRLTQAAPYAPIYATAAGLSLSGEAMQEEDGPTAAAGFDVLNMPGLMPKDEPSAEAAEVEKIEEDSLFREPGL